MPLLTALELEKHLDRVAALPVCAVVGDNASHVELCVGLLEHAAAPADQPGSTVLRLSDEVAAHQVFDELRTIPFMGMPGRRVVIVEDGAEFLKMHGERLITYLENPSSTSTLILCVPKLDRRTKMAKLMVEAGVYVDCGRVTWADARAWVTARARAAGARMSRGAAYALVDAVGPNIVALGNEVDKLAAYCGGDEVITEEAIAEVAVQGRSRSIFDLANAVATHDVAVALRLTGRLIQQDAKPPAVIAVLARQMRQLWTVKRMLAEGKKQREIERALDMRDWMVRKAETAARPLTDAWFARMLELLAAADVEFKTTSVRESEEPVWVENLVARLCGVQARS